MEAIKERLHPEKRLPCTANGSYPLSLTNLRESACRRKIFWLVDDINGPHSV
jgi:hypothetical protein